MASALIRRYSLALYDESLTITKRAAFLRDLQYLKDVIASQKEVAFFVYSALLSADQRRSIWQSISQGLHPLLVRFVDVLIRADRIIYIENMIHTFHIMEKEQEGIHTASISSAQLIAHSFRGTVTAQVAEMLRLKPQKLRIEWKVKDALIGGLSLRYGNRLWDVSLRRQLQEYFEILKA